MSQYFHNKSTKLGKRARTRSALIDSTIDMVAKKGLENVSIKEIAENAGMANGTFYNHFENREHAAVEAIVSIIREIASDIAEVVDGIEDGFDRIIVSTDIMLHQATEKPSWGALMIGTLPYVGRVQEDVTESLRNDLEYAKNQGLIEIDINPVLEAQIMQIVALGISQQIRIGPSRQVQVSTIEAVLRLVGCSPKDATQRVGRVLKSLNQ